MKHTHLSNFQKEQYTSYLETQLQKFSAFMLSQKKENEKYRFLEQGLSSQADIIDHLQSKMQMAQVYQRQTLTNLQSLSQKYQKIQNLQNRLQRLEDRERFDCDRQARKKHQMMRRQGKNDRQNDGKDRNVDSLYIDVIKRLKKIEEELFKHRDTPLPKFSSADSFDAISLLEEGTSKKLKKMQKKMKKYFNERFEEIQYLVKHSKKNKSKSPTARTPIEMSTMSYYQIDKLEKPLSQFRLEDRSVNKSELSTILRQSKNTIASNKLRTPIQLKKSEKQKIQKENIKNSRSKSKSKSKNKRNQKIKSKNIKQSRSISKSKSKSRKIDKSESMSDNSFFHSQFSKSKSILSKNQIKDIKENKKTKQKSKKKAISKSRSHHSSISLHQKCKRRPQYEVYLSKNAKSRQKIYSSQNNQSKKQ